MKHLLTLFIGVLPFVSCSKDSENDATILNPYSASRTVIVYISAENNLSSIAQNNISDMAKGLKEVGSAANLIIFADKASSTEKPFIARINNATQTVDTLYKYSEDFNSMDPDKMQEVLVRATAFGAGSQDYALVLWGHGSGWMIENNSTSNTPKRAYGLDSNNNQASTQGVWINIPDLHRVLSNVGKPWTFIFFDCCNMQCVEVGYELRDITEYIIASPAEITSSGAPYSTIVKDFFIDDVTSMYTSICDHYYEKKTNYLGMGDEHLPISTVKTKSLPDLAKATKNILPEISDYLQTANATKGLIYYYTEKKTERYHVMYDMNDMILAALADAPEKYEAWKKVLNQTVVYSRYSNLWHALNVDFSDFRSAMTPERYGGISMFFPLDRYNMYMRRNYNEDIKQMEWYQAIGW